MASMLAQQQQQQQFMQQVQSYLTQQPAQGSNAGGSQAGATRFVCWVHCAFIMQDDMYGDNRIGLHVFGMCYEGGHGLYDPCKNWSIYCVCKLECQGVVGRESLKGSWDSGHAKRKKGGRHSCAGRCDECQVQVGMIQYCRCDELQYLGARHQGSTVRSGGCSHTYCTQLGSSTRAGGCGACCKGDCGMRPRGDCGVMCSTVCTTCTESGILGAQGVRSPSWSWDDSHAPNIKLRLSVCDGRCGAYFVSVCCPLTHEKFRCAWDKVHTTCIGHRADMPPPKGRVTYANVIHLPKRHALHQPPLRITLVQSLRNTTSTITAQATSYVTPMYHTSHFVGGVGTLQKCPLRTKAPGGNAGLVVKCSQKLQHSPHFNSVYCYLSSALAVAWDSQWDPSTAHHRGFQ
eukprot:313179-Amphidinium_carterae.3